MLRNTTIYGKTEKYGDNVAYNVHQKKKTFDKRHP